MQRLRTPFVALSILGTSLVSCAEPEPPPAPVPPPVVRTVLSVEARFDAIRAELSTPADGLTTSVAIEGSTANFSRLRRALESVVRADLALPEGPPPQARIAMFGSSHVAGDLVSGFLRDRLQRQFGDAGHGYVTAVPPYEDYWQRGVHVEEGEGWGVVEASSKFLDTAAFGLNGMAFDALEPAWAELTAERASHVELFYASQPLGGELEISIDGVSHVLSTESAPTEAPREGRMEGPVEGPMEGPMEGAVEHIALVDDAHRVRIETDGTRPVRLFGVAFERDVPGVLVDQLGLNGTIAAHLVQSDEAVQRALLSSRRPDLFVMWLGTNEASEDWPLEVQATRFRAAIERLSSAMPGAGCLVIGPLDRRQHDPHGNPFVPWALGPIAAMQHDVALEQGCAFYDAMAWQEGEGPLTEGTDGPVERFEAATPPLIRPDRVHLTFEGYVRFATDLTRALLEVLARTEP